MNSFFSILYNAAFSANHTSYLGNLLADAATLLITLLFSLFVYYITKIIVFRVVKASRIRKKISFRVVLFNRRTIKLLINLTAAWVFFSLTKIILEVDKSASKIEIIANKLALLYIFILFLLFVSFVVAAINEFYERKFDFSRQYPIYSYLKVVIVFVWVLGFILIGCYFTSTSPWAFLTGLGAVSAVLLLIFRDTLLGIVASIQVTASNIVRIGDRISIDSAGIDGTVLDIAISTVKIKNADNTIASIPTYSLSSQVVKNWRTMEESGARRIKHAINIDIESIQDLDASFLAILAQKSEFTAFIKQYMNINNNLTLYRYYVTDYLTVAKEINKNYPILVHHLDTSADSLQLEVIAYTFDITWIGHELIKASLFEHFFVIFSYLGLKIKRD